MSKHIIHDLKKDKNGSKVCPYCGQNTYDVNQNDMIIDMRCWTGSYFAEGFGNHHTYHMCQSCWKKTKEYIENCLKEN